MALPAKTSPRVEIAPPTTRIRDILALLRQRSGHADALEGRYRQLRQQCIIGTGNAGGADMDTDRIERDWKARSFCGYARPS
jgi:hypothetical protein